MIFRRLIFIFAFLLAQSAALAHDIGHDERDQVDSCELCHAHAGLDQSISGNDQLLTVSHDPASSLVSADVTAHITEKYRRSLPRDPPA
jgi:hypothetical protein